MRQSDQPTRWIVWVWCTLMLSVPLLWSPFSWSQWQVLPDPVQKSERDTREYQPITLANGMTVLLVSDPKATKSLAAVTLPVGSMDDPDAQLGLAHYLEHMILMGSKKYPEADGFSLFLNQNGGSHNASTAPYRTSYYLEVENSAFDQAVDRLSDALAEPLLDPKNGDRERHAVNAEMVMARSRDGMRLGEVDSETINPKHPTARFSGGNLETLSDKPNSKLHTELRHFYNKYYSANIMQAVLYSTLPLDKMAAIADQSFGKIANHKISAPQVTVPVTTQKEEGVIIHYVPVQPLKALRIEFTIPNDSGEFRSKVSTYIAYMIDNRNPGTLADWLLRQGLADGIQSSADPMQARNGGTFGIYISLTDKGLAHRDEIIAAVFRYLRELEQKGVQKSYFDEIADVLKLDFRYQSVTRDMGYVEDLSDNMLRVPVANVLNAGMLADQYNPEAIRQRLALMTAQNARIWFISPKEPHNKKAYFVDAPYQVNKITQDQFAIWQQMGAALNLKLPALNPYIPDDFTLQKAADSSGKPLAVINKPTLQAWLMPSTVFADEPKGVVTLTLRNPDADNTARNQVLFALTDYLASLSLDELSYQAGIGGIGFSSSNDNGLQVSASGFTQHLPKLMLSLLQGYRDFTPTAAQLVQAKAWYRDRLASVDKARAYQQAVIPLQSLSAVPYFERPERLALLDSITLDEMLQYRTQLLKQSTPALLAVGNFSQAQVRDLAEQVKSQLQTAGDKPWYGETVAIKRAHHGYFDRRISASDSALAALYVPLGYGEREGQARAALLGQILQPLFFNQLRTQEQLGYAVFSYAMPVGRQWGLSFVLQTPDKTPAYLYARYQAFYKQAAERLASMPATEFTQFKNALLNELRQPPQTLDEEAARFSGDFSRGNTAFNGRNQLISAIETLTAQDIVTFYQDAVMRGTGLSLLSEVQGGKEKDGFAQPKQWSAQPSVSALQNALSKVSSH
ncbi:MAG: pitrilysin [Plesiomonas sp.]|uniref:pitrilysin n=1 Tax=Plesiomonas sp. TaxID=2486279 RepID=UPI003F390FBC